MSCPPAMSLRARHATVVLCLALVTGFVACGGDTTPPATTNGQSTGASTTAPATTTAPTPATGTTVPAETITVYFADADAQGLVAERHVRPDASSELRAALLALAEGPSDPVLQPALPVGTAIVGTAVDAGVATINLSREFISGYPSGGAAAEFAVLGALVYTATGVDGVNRVRITVDGQTPAPVGSQFDWSGTFTRQDFPVEVSGP